MKQAKIAGIVLTFLNMILIVVCVVFYLGLDRTAPELEFQASETIYIEGADNPALFEGITAYDSEDGDVTDRIVIEKTIENRDNETIVVFYAVSDMAGNVEKASRVFKAIYSDDNSIDSDADQFMEAGINAELNRNVEQNENETGSEPENMYEDAQETPEESGELSPEEPLPEPSEEPTHTPIATSQPLPEPTPKPVPTADPSVPVLSLNTSEVKVNAGQGPAWVDVIGTLSDDKDDYETLFKNLSVSKYDMNKPGTYQVTVSTQDSDGNKSVDVPLTIIVI